ncbi:glycosyltransferase family 2 protein [Motilimonas sp. E26]|uniref:glycosyltransferase family 2 protein n=1 Tax=Motilimonas sp. E26 TaxID=2865674 RepID=UPI001E42F090|nr:glycosyltransferase family 2 protein [Motilimonas sp. E26]MCE0558549.1 glycosyltransferase family 2 protein [Motilimonas sp. E26]
MAKIYISIVSHANDDDLIFNADLREISKLNDVIVIVRDNVDSSKLRDYCLDNGFIYSASAERLGFGANNNINYEQACEAGMLSSDWFLLLNPDITVSVAMFRSLIKKIESKSSGIYSANLYSDEKLSMEERSLRKFPNIFSFFNLFFGKSLTTPYIKSELVDGAEVDWAAGSFLIIHADLYRQLGGFDERYFMYFEDVDLCFRAQKKFNEKVVYMKDIKVVHRGGYQNRNFFSPHFRWYLSSMIRFMLRSFIGRRNASTING